jgi:general stress protein YciG
LLLPSFHFAKISRGVRVERANSIEIGLRRCSRQTHHHEEFHQMANQGNQGGGQSGGNQSRGGNSGGNNSGGNNASERGFAAMDKDEQREIAKKGGESVPDEKRSFSQDRELASEAGKKGGESRGNQGGR